MKFFNILNRIKGGWNSTYIKNLRVLLTGAGISQIILLVVSPLLTRLYDPASFGYYEVFNSIVAIIVTLAFFQYDLTIYLYDKEEECINALCSAVTVLAFVCSIVAIGLIFFKSTVGQIFHINFEAGWEYLIPIYVFFCCSYTILINWFTKFSAYKTIAKSRIYLSLIVASLQIFFGYLKLGHFGLILSTTVVQIVAFIILFIPFFRKYNYAFPYVRLNTIKDILIKNKRYPLLVLPGNFINNFAQNLPSFFLVKYDPTIVGYYSLSRRIIGFPLSFISNSVQSIFMKEASDEYNKNGKTISAYKKNLKIFSAIAIALFILVLTLSDFFVPYIFGSLWSKSVIYIKILSILYLIRFISGGLSFVMVFGKGPKIDIFWQIGFLAITYSCFYISTFFNLTAFNTIFTYITGLSTFYFMYMYQSYKLSLNNN